MPALAATLANACRRSRSRTSANPAVSRIARHGSGLHDLLDGINSEADLGRHFGGLLYEVEARYLMRDEWAVEPDDVLWRRTKEGLHMSEAERAAFGQWMAELRPNST